tara:strand:+ start:94 stop:339 length:246 start_codon:yes stop_codon:yes gene_type:complete
MKCFLLVALTAGLLSPIAAKAESYKLLVKVREFSSLSTSVLTMASKEACEEGKKKIMNKDNWDGDKFTDRLSMNAICIKSE